jgi:hypothetical protein
MDTSRGWITRFSGLEKRLRTGAGAQSEMVLGQHPKRLPLVVRFDNVVVGIDGMTMGREGGCEPTFLGGKRFVSGYGFSRTV